MTEPLYPRVRHGDPDVSVRELAGEFVVFDASRSKVHALNRTASAVWRLSDGETSVDEIAAALGESFELGPEDAHSLVMMSLARLEKADLLTAPVAVSDSAVPTRREALQAMAGVGVAALLPVVQSLLAPGAAQAQSVVNCVGEPCHISQGIFCGEGCRCSKRRGQGVCLRA